MKAAVCRSFGAPLEIEDVTLSPPEEGQVEIAMRAVAICHSDILFMDGAWGGHLPAVYGHEAAGHVLRVGENVDGFTVGDPVLVTLIRSCGSCPSCGAGFPTDCENPGDRLKGSPLRDSTGAPIEQGMHTAAFAERVVVDQSQLAKLPDDMAMEVASLLACGAITGIGAVLNAAVVRPGASVAVIGAGGVGLNTVQGARLAGASKIVAVDLEEDKLVAAKEFGATDGLLASDRRLSTKIRLMTGKRGADVVFVTVGSVKAYEQALEFLAPRGQLIMVGMTASGDEMRLEPVNIAGQGQVLRGTKMGDTVLSRDIPKLLEWYKSGDLKLDELISKKFRFDQINEAIAASKTGQARRNVILFD